MNDEIILTIQLFGGFRAYSELSTITLNAMAGETVSAIKMRLLNYFEQTIPGFKANTLIHSSALANETRILAADETINASGIFAILPPVCGG